jgi:HlyD family secretion protein
VRLGLRTLDAVEVLEGLNAGDRVLLKGTLAPGERVRVSVVAWQPGRATAATGVAEDPGSMIGNAVGR